jgi:hypothetical protein
MMIDSIDFPEDGSCPDCGCTIFRPGPRGGMGQNIECVRCLNRFNVCRYYPELDPAHIARHGWPAGIDHLSKGTIVWAQRIPSEADGGGAWREDLFPKVLE